MSPIVLFDAGSPFSTGQGIWVWTFEPSILIGLAAWTIGYILLVGPVRRLRGWGPPLSRARQLSFHLGSLLVLLALVSPLDHLSDSYLLTAHMIQHLLLLVVAPPLWLMGMPNVRLDQAIGSGRLQKFVHGITRPISAFLIFNAVVWAWHVPGLYDAALANNDVHILEHLMFLAAALIGWWPVLGFLPETAPRASYPVQMMYLFAMMMSTTGLGALLSLAQYPLYPFYLNAPRVLGSMPLPTHIPGPRLWGLSVMDDQQLAGLIMWVPGNMLYFSALMVVLSQWFRNEEKRQRERESLEDLMRKEESSRKM
ncbi:MAG TPA: cytochrome c oxidase assembly protein [Anaerolineaceae bacterium]|nr:cytochrome c oxidase assembly protein [Anaerolineaceae bacterium]